MTPRRIYVASSWRNPIYGPIVSALRDAGHEVYDFRNPAPGNKGFAWRDCGGAAASEGPGFGARTIPSYLEAIRSPRAIEGFGFDKAALDWADTCVLVLPCGRSAHLEAGYAAGQAKKTYVLLHEDKFEPELMYRLNTDICTDVQEVIDLLGDLEDNGVEESPDELRATVESQSREIHALRNVVGASFRHPDVVRSWNHQFPDDQREVPAPETGYCIRHVDGRWRTLDYLGIADWTRDAERAVCFRLKAHANAFAAEDLEDVRIVQGEASWTPEQFPAIPMPKSNRVQRRDDMSPRGYLALVREEDGDVVVTSCGCDNQGLVDPGSSVQFCTPGSGGGRSSRTHRALLDLMIAMERDNEDRLVRDPDRTVGAPESNEGLREA